MVNAVQRRLRRILSSDSLDEGMVKCGRRGTNVTSESQPQSSCVFLIITKDEGYVSVNVNEFAREVRATAAHHLFVADAGVDVAHYLICGVICTSSRGPSSAKKNQQYDFAEYTLL